MKTVPLFFGYISLIFFCRISVSANLDFCADDWRGSQTLKQLAQHPEWLRLLHFRRNQTRFSSQADGQDFFISKSGHRDPEAEMVATIEGMCSGHARPLQNQPRIPKTPVLCQYPARLRWLGQNWPDSSLRDQVTTKRSTIACPELDSWRGRNRTQSVKVVFSSYYANNPSSVFGHSLLRLDPYPSDSAQSTALLSAGINFAAEVGPLNPVVYAIYGMIGLFPGKFTAIPYYYKVREYSDFESRDLWEYELRLTKEEIEQLIDHIWELGFTHFNYYYFTENCSYHLLTALEGAIPRLKASENIPWWVIPIDSVKAIVRSPGILGTVHFRPSLYSQFLERKNLLQKTEVDRLHSLTENRDLNAVQDLPSERQAYVLDAALDYWDFKYSAELLAKDLDKSDYKQKLLGLRASLPLTPTLVVKPPVRPDLSHGSMRYGIYSEAKSFNNATLGLDLRFALHDWLDPVDGYPETAKIEFFRFRFDALEVDQEQTKSAVRLREYSFFDVNLLSPLTKDDRHFSWRALIGADRRRELGCDECLAMKIDSQFGLTTGLLNNRVLLFGLAGGQLRWSQEQEPNPFILVPTWTVGARFKFNPKFLAWSEYNREYLFGINKNDRWRTKVELRYSPSLRFSIGAGWEQDGWSQENRALVQFYHYR